MAARELIAIALAGVVAACAADEGGRDAETTDAGTSGATGAPATSDTSAGTQGQTTSSGPSTGASTTTSTTTSDDGSSSGEADESTGDDGLVDGIVGVGYGGLRVVSRDLGQSWPDKAELSVDGGDDENLLRGVAWGNGTWVATGWKLLTSTDGIAWDEHEPADGCAVMEGLAFGNGIFVGACGDDTMISTDGIQWSPGGQIAGGVGGHTYLLFLDGLFAASGDSGVSFTSPDGIDWEALEIDNVRACENELRSASDCNEAAWFEGAWLRAQWQGQIQRSTDGESWDPVYDDASMNTLFDSFAFARGRVAP